MPNAGESKQQTEYKEFFGKSGREACSFSASCASSACRPDGHCLADNTAKEPNHLFFATGSSMESSRSAPLHPVPPGLSLPPLKLPLLGALGEGTWHASPDGSGWTAPKVPLFPETRQPGQLSLIVLLDDRCDDACVATILELDAQRTQLRLDGKPLSLNFVSLGSSAPPWGERVYLSRDGSGMRALQSRLLADSEEILQERLAVLHTPMTFAIDSNREIVARANGFPSTKERGLIHIEAVPALDVQESTKTQVVSANFLTIALLVISMLGFAAALWYAFLRYNQYK